MLTLLLANSPGMQDGCVVVALRRCAVAPRLEQAGQQFGRVGRGVAGVEPKPGQQVGHGLPEHGFGRQQWAGGDAAE